MLAQTLIVAALVAACSVYVVWALMPSTLRRAVAVLLARQPMLARWGALRRAAAQPDGGCGCDGCDKSAKPAGRAVDGIRGSAVIRLVPRRPR